MPPEYDVAIARAELADLTAEPSAEDVTAAEAAVLNAQAELDDLLTGPDEEGIVASEAALRAAGADVASAAADLKAAWLNCYPLFKGGLLCRHMSSSVKNAKSLLPLLFQFQNMKRKKFDVQNAKAPG